MIVSQATRAAGASSNLPYKLSYYYGFWKMYGLFPITVQSILVLILSATVLLLVPPLPLSLDNLVLPDILEA